MDSDLLLVIGLVLAGLSIPAIISAFSEGRPPRGGAILVVVGGGLVALAMMNHPTGYAIGDLPDVFIRVVARIIN